MVDIHKQTIEFINEYGCSYLHARQSAILSQDLCEATSKENIAVNLALSSWKIEQSYMSVQFLKASAIAVLLFTDYYYQKHAGKTQDNNIFPNLAKDIYPLVAIVMEKPKSYIPIYIRSLRKHFPTYATDKDLVFALVDEALEFM